MKIDERTMPTIGIGYSWLLFAKGFRNGRERVKDQSVILSCALVGPHFLIDRSNLKRRCQATHAIRQGTGTARVGGKGYDQKLFGNDA